MLIQIVDDNQNMRHTIRSVLGELQAIVLESSNGEDALRQFAEHHPDVVLMDIRMAPTDGIVATGLMHRLDPEACIIIVTQYDDAVLRTVAQKAGACGYVLKDDLLKLPQTIRSLTDAL